MSRALLVLLMLAAAFASATATEKFNDIGDEDDFAPTSPVAISSPTESGRWTVDTYLENPRLPDGWAPYDMSRRYVQNQYPDATRRGSSRKREPGGTEPPTGERTKPDNFFTGSCGNRRVVAVAGVPRFLAALGNDKR